MTLLATPIRVLMVDDHQLLLDGLRVLLAREPDIDVVGEATDGARALALVEQLAPSVLLVDLAMPGMHGLELVRLAATRAPALRAVVLSMHANDGYVAEALRRGALGYVLKQARSQTVIEGIRAAATGSRYVSPPLSMDRFVSYAEERQGGELAPFDTLSSRERGVLKLAAQGFTSREIAAQLGIGRRTVETHRANIARKLHVRSQTELVRAAVKHGLVD